MMAKKETKSSAFYQRQYRQRLREQGLIKKEVWIRPENSAQLLSLEKQLRMIQAEHNSHQHCKEVDTMNTPAIWSVDSLYRALDEAELVTQGSATVEVINGVDACLHIVMHDYGDLPLFLSVSNQQIVVESLLWPVDFVMDQAHFNQHVLYTRKLFPLSTIAIEQTGDGALNYIMYGALSASSLLTSVIYELEMLSANVIKATEAYEPWLNITVS